METVVQDDVGEVISRVTGCSQDRECGCPNVCLELVVVCVVM
jgi:hypothetical protein